MYHYVDEKDKILDDKEDRPVFGLGEKIWKIGKKQRKVDANQDSYDEIELTTTVPGMEHVEIKKTYSLPPKDYHAKLLIEINDKRDPKGTDKESVKFRYQLTGGQGLPIEGEWYTSTFRNAMIGMVDPQGNLYRQLEDSTRPSASTRAATSFPKGNRDVNRLQYAGVANQYFASMLVVDNEQPNRDDGGNEPDKILHLQRQPWRPPRRSASSATSVKTAFYFARRGAKSTAKNSAIVSSRGPAGTSRISG